ncbi:MAG: hypothetical protein JKY36_07625 [Erythrobacter sp.]|nr:hypothetical protein [Erythrobacter sp.]
MRKLIFPALATAAFVAPASLLAQDASDETIVALEERESPFSEMAERMRDPENQRQMALMLRTMSEVLLDMPLAPLMNSVGEIAGEDAPRVDPDATLRSVAPEADRVPEEIEKNLPRALDTMGSMADAFEQMMPALEQMAERLRDAAPQAD